MQELLLNLNSVELCLQTFGDQHNPAVLLIYGAAGQGILWNIDLCKNIAKEGYFVIRYDNRDTGKSSAINYELSFNSLETSFSGFATASEGEIDSELEL